MKYPVFIEPGNDDGALLDASAVKGGFVVVETLNDLTTLLLEHSGSIITGTHCYVGEEDKTYIYDSEENEWNESSVDSDVTDLLSRISTAESSITTLNDRINKNVVNNLSITTSGDTVNVNTQTINILNNSTATDSDALPLATNSNAGLMSQTDYQTLYNINSRIENLEGTTDRLLYVVEDTLKTITYDGNEYSPAFYINNFLYQVGEGNTQINKVFNGILLDFTWVGALSVTLPTPTTYNINFTSNGTAYTSIEFTNTRILYKNESIESVAYDGGSWLSNYRTILFTGGTDINNSSLITWLQNNKTSLYCFYLISGNTCTIKGIVYTFDGWTVGSKITRSVSASNINNFVTTIYDKNGQQLYFPPFRGIAVVIDGTYHIWHYYPNEDGGVVIGWKDDGVDTVSQFTNSAQGTIQGSNVDGQVYAESNGTGSVVGWASLKNRVTNVENNKAPNTLASDNNNGLLSSTLYTKLNNLGLANANTNGLMSSSQYTKLSGIATGAQVNVLEGVQANGTTLTPDANKLVNIKEGNNITFTADGTNDIIINATIPDPVTIDDELSSSSINPVQNKVITEALADKVDKVSGKGLSTEDFTTAEKTKLGTVETNANYYVLPNDVIRDSSYVHTDNNFTTALKDKLNGISSGAQANVIEGIQKNGTSLPINNKIVNITVPVNASDVGALPTTTKYASALSLSMNNETFVITAQLKDQNGDNLGSAQTVDLPLESLITSAEYYDTYTYEGTTYTDVIVMIFSTGQTIIIPVADLVQGFQREITTTNKLASDLVDDTNQTNLFVTSTEKDTWNAKQDALVSGTSIKTINNTSILGSGNLDTKELFYCTYGTTTYAEITQALGNNKLCYCIRGSNCLPFAQTASNGDYKFSGVYGGGVVEWTVKSTNVWSTYSFTPQSTASRVTTISSSSTDTQYPSALAVYDYVQPQVDGKVSKTGNETISGVKTFEDRPLGVVDKTILPITYQEVEYIEADNSSYINTGVIPDGTTKVILNYGLTASSKTNNENMLFGSSSALDSTIPAFWTSLDNSGNLSYRYFTNSGSASTISNFYQNYTSGEMEFSSDGLYIDGTSIGATQTPQTNVSNLNIYLFARNKDGVADSNTPYRLYQCSILKDDVLERKFIPCYRKSDDEIGLYDVVNDVFYTNGGSGTITKGANKVYKEEFALKGDLPDIVTNPLGEATEQLSKIEIDGTVYQISVEGQGLTLLWTNANYDSSFTAQTVSLTLTSYDGALIVLSDDTGVAHQSSFLYLRDNLPYRATISSEGFLTYRDITVTNFGVVFSAGLVSSTYNSTPTTDNTYCIPYQIYGVRFAAGSGSGSGGSNVIGNPTGIATETLSKISIDNIIYEIPSAITVDDSLSTTSSNPVQNSVITNALNNKVGLTGNDTIEGTKVFTTIPKYGIPNLPSAYQEVEYIKATSNNVVFNTNITPTSSLKTQIKFKYTNRSGGMFYGSSGSGDNADYRFFIADNTTYWDLWDSRLSGDVISLNTLYELELGNNYVKNLSTGSNILSGSTKSFTWSSTNKIQIFSGNDYGEIYYVKIYNGDTLAYHFIPCYRKVDNVVGLYDVINDNFITNTGSGTVTANAPLYYGENFALVGDVTNLQSNLQSQIDGKVSLTANEIVRGEKTFTVIPRLGEDRLPSQFTEVEYIEFTGTQYINTNLIPSNHKTEIKYDIQTYVNDAHILGTDASSSYYHFTTYSNSYYWGLNGSENHAGTFTTGIHTLYYNTGENHQVILDTTILGSGSNISASQNLLIGRRSSTTNLKAKIYYCKVTNLSDNTLVRNLVPCYTNQSVTNNGTTYPENTIGLYDIVNNIFYVNAGSGVFIKGNNVLIGDRFATLTDVNSKVSLTGNETINGTKTFKKRPNLGIKAIPEDYTELEYILGNGGYVDVGVKDTQIYGFEFKMLPVTFSNSYQAFMGAYYDNFNISYTDNNSNIFVRIRGNIYFSSATISRTNPTTWKYINGTLYMNSSTASVGTGTIGTANVNLNLYRCSSGERTYTTSCRIYYLKIYDNSGNLIKSLIPVQKNSNNALGFYDTVNNTFIQGSGALIAGPEAEVEVVDTDPFATLTDVATKVGLTGNETIEGTKTFSTRPLVGITTPEGVALQSEIPTIEANNQSVTTATLTKLNVNGVNYAVSNPQYQITNLTIDNDDIYITIV